METWRPDEFIEQLRQVGRQQYHDKHPFHRLMNEGRLTREQVQLWVANRCQGHEYDSILKVIEQFGRGLQRQEVLPVSPDPESVSSPTSGNPNMLAEVPKPPM